MARIPIDYHGNTGFSDFEVLWSMVQHIPWVDWYSGGASQDCMPLQWAQKVCIHGVIQ